MQWQYFSTNLYMHDARQYPMPLLEFEELSFCRDMPLRTDACLHHTSPSAVFTSGRVRHARQGEPFLLLLLRDSFRLWRVAWLRGCVAKVPKMSNMLLA